MTFKHPDSSSPAPSSPKAPPWLPALNRYFDPWPPDKFKRGLGNDDERWLIPFPEAADFLNIKPGTLARRLRRLEIIENRKAYFGYFTEQNGRLLILCPCLGGLPEEPVKYWYLSCHFRHRPGHRPNQAKKEGGTSDFCTLEAVWLVGMRLDNPRGDHLRHMFYNKMMQNPYYDLLNNLRKPGEEVAA
jgi:DNA-binding Lrp family transcriptional regulator